MIFMIRRAKLYIDRRNSLWIYRFNSVRERGAEESFMTDFNCSIDPLKTYTP